MSGASLKWERGETWETRAPDGVMYYAEYDGRVLEIHRIKILNTLRGQPRYRYWLSIDGQPRGSWEPMLSTVRAQATSMAAWSELARNSLAHPQQVSS